METFYTFNGRAFTLIATTCTQYAFYPASSQWSSTICNLSLHFCWTILNVIIRSCCLTDTPVEQGFKRSHSNSQIPYFFCRKIQPARSADFWEVNFRQGPEMEDTTEQPCAALVICVLVWETCVRLSTFYTNSREAVHWEREVKWRRVCGCRPGWVCHPQGAAGRLTKEHILCLVASGEEVILGLESNSLGH